MAFIPDQVIEDIKKKARIEDIISHYIDVQQKGRNYVAICPFHDDHDPSLQISSEKQLFKCFVCGTGGDVFSFVAHYEKIGYAEAVRKVASLIKYDYDFGSFDKKDYFVETPEHKALKEAVLYCRNALNSQEGLKVKEYLRKRNISQNIIDRFEMGYNPSNDALFRYLTQKGHREKDIISADLARLTVRGIMDVFRDRLMIPIHDSDGHPIGFTARSIDPNADRKYINSKDSPLFRKGNIIFNYHRAKDAIKARKYAIMAEGPMDVMAFNKAGIENAVCTLGTACTRDQLGLLKKLTNQLLLAYDGDDAGQNAIFKAGKLAASLGFTVKVINNKTQDDPDEIVNKYGADALKKMIRESYTWIEFIFAYQERKHDLNNYSSKKEYVSAVMEEINEVQDAFDKQNYINQLEQKTGLKVESLIRNTPVKVIQQQPAPEKKKATKVNFSGVRIAEWTIINGMLYSRERCREYKNELNRLCHDTENELAGMIVNYYIDHETLDEDAFYASLPENCRKVIDDIRKYDIINKEANDEVFSDAIQEVYLYFRKIETDKEIAILEQQKALMSDPLVQAEISQRIRDLRNQLKKKEEK